jgi:FkbM family methyltransferase
MLTIQKVRAALRANIPFSLWHMAGFATRVPSYWHIDRSKALRIRNHIGGLPLYVTGNVHVFPPESLTAYLNWHHHGVEFNESRAEAQAFIELSQGRSKLIDVGAQTGFMSALFARSRLRPSRILSVEPDPQVQPLLRRARELNTDDHIDWEIAPTAVSDISGRLVMPISNKLHELAGKVCKSAEIEVPAVTLTDLLDGIDWSPDIIKIDVESFEYEILCSSLTVIETLKPALQLEVHWQMLARREKDPRDFLGPLAAIGYRGLQSGHRNLDRWIRAGRNEAVSRFSLCAQ